MTLITLPSGRQDRRLVFYLAMEEYIAANLDLVLKERKVKDAFFMWQVKPTVIFGRNQVMEAEVNMDFCKRRGIQLYRRKSGGGCVYSDKGNIMLSYITDSTDVTATFDKYLKTLSGYLSDLGLNAEKSGRNDILVDGKKVSGNAFFQKPKTSIVHGTMLFDTDFDELEQAITPSHAKIQSKGVSSVRQHVTNLRPYFLDSVGNKRFADIEVFKEYLAERFCGTSAHDGKSPGLDCIELTSEQIGEIEKIEAGYLDPAFLLGRNHSYSVSHSGKIPGIGEMTVELDIDSERIRGCHLSGDYFPVKEGIDEYLSRLLNGRQNTGSDAARALQGALLSAYIPGLDPEMLLDIMYKQDPLSDLKFSK